MAESSVVCPKCGHSFALAESVERDVRARLSAEFQAMSDEKSADFERRFADEKVKLNQIASRQIADAKAALLSEARAAAEGDVERLRLDAENSKRLLDAQSAKLREVQGRELDLLNRAKALDDAKAEFELDSARKLDEERARIRAEAESRIGEEHSRKASEWEHQRLGMEKLIEDLKRRSEQGSTQTQGEAFELGVEAALREAFVHDEITEVKKGVTGCDIVQRVQSQGGVYAGAIAWELKNTRSWSDGWVQKVKDDAREAKADVAVIVTAAMPKGASRLTLVEGVWVVETGFYLGLAHVLRSGLHDVAKARAVSAGRESKATALYAYVTGNEFRGRVEQVVEAFARMTEDLAAERRALDKLLAQRQKQLERALSAVAGLYGDVSGLTPLPEIPALALEARQ